MAIIGEQMKTMADVPLPAQPAQPGEEEADEPDADYDNPAYQQALQILAKALYESGADKDIATVLTKSPNVIDALAKVAYDLISAAVEKTDNQVPEELYLSMVDTVMEELNKIAEKAGLKLKDSQIARAVSIMVDRYLGELGQDTTELRAAMGAVPDDVFDKLGAQ